MLNVIILNVVAPLNSPWSQLKREIFISLSKFFRYIDFPRQHTIEAKLEKYFRKPFFEKNKLLLLSSIGAQTTRRFLAIHKKWKGKKCLQLKKRSG